MTSSEKDTVSMFSGSGSTAGSTRRGLYTILYDTAFNVLELPLRAVRLVTSALLRGDQSRATIRPSRWSRVVVRLDLYLEDGYQPAYGTGFLLHVPGSQKDIIVTAGHNLIRSIEEGRDRVTPKIGVRLIDPDTNTQSTEFVYPASYRISKAYESSPGEGTEADDYGIILLDRRVNADGVVQGPREAFGFNIVLAGMDLSTSQPGAVLNAQVGGYPGMQQEEKLEAIPNFETGNGNFGKFSERVVYYHGGTDQGMSGGPVWVNFLGEEIVVGIHNKHEDIPGEGNRGARLTLPVILDILKWAGVSTPLLNKAIKASSKGIPGAAAEGYYIQSLLNHDHQEQKPAGESEELLCYAWSGPIRNPAVTTFDIIPAQASPSYSRSSNNTHYVISTSLSTWNRKRMFLEFFTSLTYAPKQVGLTEKPGAGNLVRFVQGGLVGAAKRGGVAAEPDGDKTFKPYEPFRISITQNHDTEKLSKSQPYPEFKLTLWSEDIPPADDTFGLERARLGLIVRPQRYRAKPPCDYEDFQLE